MTCVPHGRVLYLMSQHEPGEKKMKQARRFTYVVVRGERQTKLDLTTAEVEQYRANGWTVNGPVAF